MSKSRDIRKEKKKPAAQGAGTSHSKKSLSAQSSPIGAIRSGSKSQAPKHKM